MAGKWIERMEEIMEEQYAQVPAKDFRFYHADKIIKYARVIDKNRKEHPELKTAAVHLEELAGETAELINGSIRQKTIFEKKLHHIEKELRKTLHLKLKGFYIASYTFIGMFLGLVGGYLFWTVFGWHSLLRCILIGWMIGLLTGQYYGGIKERKMFRQGKIVS